MRKRILAVLMPVLLVCLLTAQAVCAADLRAAGGTPSLSFDGTTAICSVICQGNRTTDKIEATLTLYQGSTTVDSWSASGTRKVSFSGECAVRSGKTYRLELTCSINGVEKPSVSVTKTCP